MSKKEAVNISYQVITDKIIERLQAGVIPWRHYSNVRFSESCPRNLVSKKAYRGMNIFILASMGYSSPYWVSFKQAKALGGSVMAGEKSTPVTYWHFFKSLDKETGKVKTIPFLKYYRVWNVEQCSGLEKKIPAPTEPRKLNINKEGEAIIKGMPNPPILKKGAYATASYSPSLDTVKMTKQSLCTSDSAYYSVLFHEFVHSTGHESRLGRPLNGLFLNRQSYSAEELIAEMGAAFLSGEVGISQDVIDNQAAYISNWLTVLQNDPKMVVLAAGKAQKAVDHIMNRKFEAVESDLALAS